MTSKRKLTALSIKDKFNIIKAIEEEDRDKKEICRKYKCDISTVNRTLKKKFEIIEAVMGFENLHRKRRKKVEHESVDKALWIWFKKQKQKNTIMDTSVLIEKAKEFVLKFNDDFKPDAAWLYRWRKRHCVTLYDIHNIYPPNEGDVNHNMDSDDINRKPTAMKNEHNRENSIDVYPDLSNEYSTQTVINVSSVQQNDYSTRSVAADNINQDQISIYNEDCKQNSIDAFPDIGNVYSPEDVDVNNVKLEISQNEVSVNGNYSALNYTNNFVPELINGYIPENVMNAGETIVYYKALPTNSYYQPYSQPNNHKGQKAKFTVLFICNAAASYKRVYVIGKSKTHFKNATPPIPYYFSENALLTTILWQEILHSLDIEMQKFNKKIILFVNNSSCPKYPPLTNIVVEFSSRNRTNLIQPLDQGIISSFKANYRQIIARKQYSSLKRNMSIDEFYKSISCLDALHFIKRAWWLVSPSCICNCFQISGLIPNAGENCLDTLAADNFLNRRTPCLNFIHCDDNVERTNVSNTINSAIKTDPENNDESEAQDDEDEAVNHGPSLKEALLALNVVQKYCYFNNIDLSVDEIETQILKATVNNT